ncbi:MAG: hypothetical protein ACREYF_18905 [Gammaproteobacteria bacterium]
MEPVQEIKLSEVINVGRAEEIVAWLGQAPDPDRRVLLDLSQCRLIEVGAGVLLGNALRRHAQLQLLEVVVPPPGDFSKSWFTAFSRSGLGLALASHARNIRTPMGVDVTESVVHYYESRFQQESQNVIVVRDLHRGYAINVNSIDHFTPRFHRWLPRVNVAPGTLDEGELATLVGLCFEAIQNVYDHADRAPLAQGCTIFSCFAMRYYRKISAPAKSGLPLRVYLERLKSSISSEEQGPAFLELVVNDDGVGIAARQNQYAGVYWADFEAERFAVAEALKPGTSIKLQAADSPIRGDPGFGSVVVLKAIETLKAFAELRTGRVRAFMDGADPSAEGFELDQGAHGYLPGTFFHIVVPLRQAQLKLL